MNAANDKGVLAVKDDPLTQALMAAACELQEQYEWSFDGHFGGLPELDGEFFTVLRKHLTPIIDPSSYIKARRDALLSELAGLDALANMERAK